MDTVNLVVMGKTGAGKSTLINAVLHEDLAPTGTGEAVTKEVAVYKKEVVFQQESGYENKAENGKKIVNLYDTVGLEIDHEITLKTLNEIRNLLKNAVRADGEKEITLVWFCVNNSSSRFEPYEAELIRSLSVEFEIPFSIVITQCYSDDKGELEKSLERDVPELDVFRVLAKEKPLRTGYISSFGLDRLLSESVHDYDMKKLSLLKNKLQILMSKNNGFDDASLRRNRDRVNLLRAQGKDIVTKAAKNAGMFIGLADHVIYVNMILALNKLFDVRMDRDRISALLNATYPNGIKSFLGINAISEGYTEIKNSVKTFSIPKIKKPDLNALKPSIQFSPKAVVDGIKKSAKAAYMEETAPNEHLRRIGNAYLEALCTNALKYESKTGEYDVEIIRVLEEILKREGN